MIVAFIKACNRRITLTKPMIDLIKNLRKRHRSLDISDIVFVKAVGIGKNSYNSYCNDYVRTIEENRMKKFEKLNQLTDKQILDYVKRKTQEYQTTICLKLGLL